MHNLCFWYHPAILCMESSNPSGTFITILSYYTHTKLHSHLIPADSKHGLDGFGLDVFHGLHVTQAIVQVGQLFIVL